jgi:hypothetical protein
MNRDYGCIELRDDANVLWPMIWLAHPEGEGEVSNTYNQLMDQYSVSGSFVLFGAGADAELIGGSRQDRRIGGSLVTVETRIDGKGNSYPARIGPDIQLDIKLKDATSADVTIVFNGKTVKADASISLRPASPQGKGSIDVTGACSTTTQALGLPGETKPVTIRFRTPARP